MKKWQVREQKHGDLETQLFFARGIESEEEKEIFLNPDYEKHLRDPLEILDMEKAVARIMSAIKKKEKIALYGDYDADGVCASAIFHDFFEKIGFDNFEIYIPDRNIEGYGLNDKALDYFKEKKIDLIVTSDCGITDYDEVRKANEMGIDTIVTDHHLQLGSVPQAVAVVDPKREDDDYPFKMFCGAGVVFKLVQALIDTGEFLITPGWEKWLLDLVAIATVADMVPLSDENRVLVHYGLKVLQKTNRVGLLTLFGKLSLNAKSITEDDIAFLIAPRINLASRMDHANTSYALLTTQSPAEASFIVGHLEELNYERKESVSEILKEIDKRISQKGGEVFLVAEGDEKWNPGVLGLAANRVMEKYGCPVFLWGRGEAEEIKGSARSSGVNLVRLMESLPKNIFIDFGGHALAAGFSLEKTKTDEFEKEIAKNFGKLKTEKVEDILWIDKELLLSDINWDLMNVIEKFSPFGMDNPKPVFLLKGLEVCKVNRFGNGGIHLRLDFKNSDSTVISAIGFFMPNGDWGVKAGDKVDLVASLERNVYREREELRLRIVDLRVLES